MRLTRWVLVDSIRLTIETQNLQSINPVKYISLIEYFIDSYSIRIFLPLLTLDVEGLKAVGALVVFLLGSWHTSIFARKWISRQPVAFIILQTIGIKFDLVLGNHCLLPSFFQGPWFSYRSTSGRNRSWCSGRTPLKVKRTGNWERYLSVLNEQILEQFGPYNSS